MHRVRELERKLRGATGCHERAIIADALAPEYVNRGDALSAARVLSSIQIPEDDISLRARILSLRGLVAAIQGEPSDPLDQAIELVDQVDDRARAQVTQRAGLRSYYEGQAGPATDMSLQAIMYSEEIEWFWMAARAAMTLYATSYHLIGDFQQALFWLERTASFANQADDAPLRRISLWGQYDLAALLGEESRHESLQQLLRRQAESPHFTEAMLGVAADALGHAWHDSFSAMLGTLDGALTRTDLIQLISFSLEGCEDSRSPASGIFLDRGSRRVELSGYHGRSVDAEAPFLSFRRHLGRVFGGATLIAGDTNAGLRSLRARRFIGTGAAAALASALSTGQSTCLPRNCETCVDMLWPLRQPAERFLVWERARRRSPRLNERYWTASARPYLLRSG